MKDNIFLCFNSKNEMIAYSDSIEVAESSCKRYEQDWKTDGCFIKKFEDVINTKRSLKDIIYDFFDMFYLSNTQLKNFYINRRGYIIADLDGDSSKVHCAMDNAMNFLFGYECYKEESFGDTSYDWYASRHFYRPLRNKS